MTLRQAAEAAEHKLRSLAAIFNGPRFTDRYGDGDICQGLADALHKALNEKQRSIDGHAIHKALDEIITCSDALYELLREPGKLGMETKGFTPCHTLNSAVGLIRNELTLSGYEKRKS